MLGGGFVAIRMIVLAHNQNADDFAKWMTVTTNDSVPDPAFLDVMGKTFAPQGLTRITFLRGHKIPLPQANQLPANRANSRPAGANADFAWITYWWSRDANQNAWRYAIRPGNWNNLWSNFMGRCYNDRTPSGRARRPRGGPPYDYSGTVTRGGANIDGLGAGCLVEGFEVIYDKTSW